MSLTESKIHELEKKANDIRSDVIKMLIEAGSGHTAGPLGMADIFTYFYFYISKETILFLIYLIFFIGLKFLNYFVVRFLLVLIFIIAVLIV